MSDPTRATKNWPDPTGFKNFWPGLITNKNLNTVVLIEFLTKRFKHHLNNNMIIILEIGFMVKSETIKTSTRFYVELLFEQLCWEVFELLPNSKTSQQLQNFSSQILTLNSGEKTLLEQFLVEFLESWLVKKKEKKIKSRNLNQSVKNKSSLGLT